MNINELNPDIVTINAAIYHLLNGGRCNVTLFLESDGKIGCEATDYVNGKHIATTYGETESPAQAILRAAARMPATPPQPIEEP